MRKGECIQEIDPSGNMNHFGSFLGHALLLASLLAKYFRM